MKMPSPGSGGVVATLALLLTLAAAVPASAQGVHITNTPTSGTVGIPYSFQFTATGANSIKYSWTCNCSDPVPGLSLSQTGSISGTPTTIGTFTIFVTATDANNADNTSGPVQMSLQIGRQLLTVTTTSVPNATRGATYSAPLAAQGGSGGYTWSLFPSSSLPDGLTVDPGGSIGTVTSLSAVTKQYTFVVQVKDSAGSTAFAQFTMTVFNPALSLTPSVLPNGIVNGPYVSGVTASGGNNGPYTYSFTGTPPPGLSLNPSTGAINGPPTTIGTYTNFGITVTDGSAFSAPFPGQGYSVAIFPGIAISVSNNFIGEAQSNYSQTFTASGGAGPAYTYSLSGTPAGMTFNPSTGVLSGTLPAGGPYPLTLIARDSQGFTASQNYSLIADPVLTLAPASVPSVVAGTSFNQTFTASGGSGGYSYTFSGNAIPGLNFSGDTLAGSPTTSGSYPFTITAKDSLNFTVAIPYTLVVKAPITVTPAAVPSGQVGVAYTTTTFTASGGSGGPYTWTITGNAFGLTFTTSTTTATLTGTPASSGANTVTVTASDGTLSGHTDYTLTIAPAALSLSSPSLGNGTTGTPYPAQTFTASGSLGVYNFSIVGTQPPGLSLTQNPAPNNNTATFGGTPTAGGTYTFSIQVSDGSKTASQSYTVTINNQAITLGPASLPAGIVNGSYSQTFAATGGNNGPYTYSLVGSTPGLSLNPTTGVLSGAPTSATTYSFTIGVTDNSTFTPAFTPKPYSIVVNPLLTISPATVPNADPQVNFSQTFTATGGAGAPYTYTLNSPPPGLAINASSGLMSGSPTTSGNFAFTITAKDAGGFSATSPSITLTVNPALTFTPATLPSGQVGTGYSQAFTATGGSGGYTFTLGPNAPPGLSITGAVLSGTPTTNGSYTFSVTAHDTLGGTASNSYTVTIGNPPIVVQPTTLPSGQVGINYSQAFSATGGNGGPYTFSLAVLPPPFGLNFASGTLSGSPTSFGTASITVNATDGTLSGQRTYSLTVLPAGLTLTPSTLVTGTIGVKYAQTLTAGGGLGTYTITLSPPSPAGLTFSNSGSPNGSTATLTGTPTSFGSFPLVATVSDGTSSLVRNYTLAISPPPLSILTTSLSGGQQASPYAANLAATGGAPPYTWTVQPSSGLPSGLSLISSGPGAGSINGTPQTYGTFPFTAVVTDSQNATASVPLSIVLQPAALSFSTTSPLPPTVSGAKYSVTFGASGGVSPYSFSLNSGPSGLTMSGGVLSGVLTNNTASPITYNLTVTLSDSGGSSIGGGFSVTVQPAAAGLILSAGSLASAAASAGSSPPPPEYLSVSSTTQAPVSFTVSSDQSWLTVGPSGGTTPATLQVTVNQTGLKAGTYTGNITVSGPDGQHTVSVTLKVNALPAQLSAAPTIVSFVTDGTSQPAPGSIQVSNIGDGSFTFTASLVNGSSWITLGNAGTVVTSAAPVSIPVNAVISGLAPGDYRDVVHIDSSAGTADIPVTLLVAGGSTISLVPAGTLYPSRQGQGISDSTHSFQIITTGNTPISWTAGLLSGSGWLTLNTPSGTSSANNPGVVSFSVDPRSLATGDFYARIHVDAPAATNSPVDFLIVSDVAAANSLAIPNPSPAGLLFISSPGSLVPAAQTIQVNSSSIAPITFAAAANTYTGGNWLSVSPSSGVTSTGAPGQVRASINAAGLATGVYQGGISFTLQGDPTGVRTVSVVLIVTGSAQSPTLIPRGPYSTRQPDLIPAAGCAPSKLVAIQTGLVSNFSTPAGWPTPLAIQLADDCGSAVSNASVVATFSNGDPPLAMQLSDSRNAVYSATWNPRGAASQVTVSARATAPALQAATAQIIGAISPNKVPILFRHGTIHNLNPQAGAPLAPGTIVQIYGSGLAPSTQQTGLPLPTNVGGTVAIIGGIEAPLYYVSDGQLNAQLPLELNAGHQYQILISANGALTTPDTIDIEPVTPGVAALTDGTIIAQHADNSYVTPAAPAHPGEILTIYLAGMGLTDVAIKTGQQTPSSPLAHPMVAPTVTVNGEQAAIAFAGLTPQAVGLYQINFTVPTDAPSGTLKLVVTQSNALSNTSTLQVQAP